MYILPVNPMQEQICLKETVILHQRPHYCRATNIGIIPTPSFIEPNAFPITAPKAFIGSSAFMA